MTPPFNVLFVTIDQWRAEALSARGHACLKTPNLDRLAAEGTLFLNHYAQATPCSPGRASLYTGLYLHNHRVAVNGTPLDRRHGNVALEARKAGYDPALFGYTDVSADPRAHHPDDPCLRSYEGILPGMTAVVPLDGEQLPWLAQLKAKGFDGPIDAVEVFRPRADYPGAAERGPTYAPTRYAAEDSHTVYLTDEAIKYIAVRQARPWFVHLSYLSPHPYFVAPEPYNALYDADAVPPIERAPTLEAEAAQHPWLAAFLPDQIGTPASVGLAMRDQIHLPEHALRQIRATYYGMVSEVDHELGRLIEHLRETGAYDRTLIVVVSDHGEQLGDHWMFGKYGYFDASFRVPLIVRDPRREADGGRGRQVGAFTENVDVMPTILDWLGLEAPAQCDGLSLLPFCRGESPRHWREEAHWAYDFRDLAGRRYGGRRLAPDQCVLNVIRGPRYKYVHFAALPPLFFDLQEDPQEFHDRAADPAYRSLVLDYAQKLISWRMTHDERVLVNQSLTGDGVVEWHGPRHSA